MTDTRQPTPPFHTALVAGASEGHQRIDREFLKQARIPHIRAAASGAEALALTRREGVDLVLCDARLTDMTGPELVAALRADPALSRIPVIMAAVDPSRAEVTRAVSLGAAGFLIRPYSQLVFGRHLALARRMANHDAAGRAVLDRARRAEAAGDPQAAARAFAAVTEGPDDVPRLFETGMAALAVKDLDRAIDCFHRALAVNAIFVEAHLGLARAWHAKGSLRQYRHFMKEAAMACARARRFEELRDRFVELLAKDEAGFNPFLALGNELLRDRHYTASVALFRQAQSLAPRNADVYLGLSKAYHFLRRPDMARRALDKSLEINDRSPEGQAMYHRLTGHNPGDITPLEQTPSEVAPGQYPWLLRGVLYLAGWAADGLLRPRRTAKAA